MFILARSLIVEVVVLSLTGYKKVCMSSSATPVWSAKSWRLKLLSSKACMTAALPASPPPASLNTFIVFLYAACSGVSASGPIVPVAAVPLTVKSPSPTPVAAGVRKVSNSASDTPVCSDKSAMVKSLSSKACKTAALPASPPPASSNTFIALL